MDTDEVRDDDAVAGPGENGDHVAVEEAPSGFAVQAEHGPPLPRPFVQVVNPGQGDSAAGCYAGRDIMSHQTDVKRGLQV